MTALPLVHPSSLGPPSAGRNATTSPARKVFRELDVHSRRSLRERYGP